MLDYKFKVGKTEDEYGKQSNEYKTIKATIDKRSAERLLWVAKYQGGMYTKIGQYISTLTHALPKEWTETLSELQDKAQARPWEEVSTVFEEDFQQSAENIFQFVEREPIAAASLAQVHRAIMKNGEEVAVKIQYPNLRRIATADMAAMNFFFTVTGKLFKDFDYTWMFPEFEQSVQNEINFLQEAHNAERVTAMFANNPRIHIPRVKQELTSSRVLTMEFIRGVKASDISGMKNYGINPRDIARIAAEFFGDQVHVHGFVHCDPHPGNLLVRLSPIDNGPQLVILDHGMYRRLTPTFRIAYCQLWQALLTRNDELGLQACRNLGLDNDSYEVMSLMLVQRGTNKSNRLGAKLTKEDIQRLREQYKDITAGDINRFMQKLPRDLLFVSRNTNMVRGLNFKLGGTARDRFRITGFSAVRGLVLTDALEIEGMKYTIVNNQLTTNNNTKNNDSNNQQHQHIEFVNDVPSTLQLPQDTTGLSPLSSLRQMVTTLLFPSSSSSSTSPSPNGPAVSIVAPLTYARALREGLITAVPTESEIQQQYTLSLHNKHSNKAIDDNEIQRMLNHSKPSLMRRLKLTWEIVKLEYVIRLADVSFAILSWWYKNSFDALDDSKGHTGSKSSANEGEGLHGVQEYTPT